MRSGKFRDADYLEHIAKRIERIERATSGVDLSGFLRNHDLQAAVGRLRQLVKDNERSEPQRHAQSEKEPDSREDRGQ